MGFSNLGYVLPGRRKIIFVGKFIFPMQYNQEKCNLHNKCIILSQTKTIEKVMFKFLFLRIFSLVCFI